MPLDPCLRFVQISKSGMIWPLERVELDLHNPAPRLLTTLVYLLHQGGDEPAISQDVADITQLTPRDASQRRGRSWVGRACCTPEIDGVGDYNNQQRQCDEKTDSEDKEPAALRQRWGTRLWCHQQTQPGQLRLERGDGVL